MMMSEGSFLLTSRASVLFCLFAYSVNGRTLLGSENDSVLVQNSVGTKTGSPSASASPNCTLDADFNPHLYGPSACDVKLEGADNLLRDSFKGGIDGVFELLYCHSGRPLYVRHSNRPSDERILYYSSTYNDWAIGMGRMPTEEDILLYAGLPETSNVRPETVDTEWYIATGLLKSYDGYEAYTKSHVSVACSGGLKTTVPGVAAGYGSLPGWDAEDVKYKFSDEVRSQTVAP